MLSFLSFSFDNQNADKETHQYPRSRKDKVDMDSPSPIDQMATRPSDEELAKLTVEAKKRVCTLISFLAFDWWLRDSIIVMGYGGFS